MTTKEDGVIREKNGRWIKAPKPPVPITTETARAMANRRWEMARQKANEGLALMAKKRVEEGDLDMTSLAGEGWKLMVEHAAEVFMKENSSRGMSDLGSFIGRATGNFIDPMAMRSEAAHSPDSMSVDDARILLQVFNFNYKEESPEADVIDGTSTDA